MATATTTNQRDQAASNVVIRASAGTGKTYRLSSRYLSLLLGGVGPEKILATTFTRKAAGEILDRVLSRLSAAVESPREREALRDSLEAPAAAERLGREECLAALVRMTKQLHRLQIGTLDSYFIRIASSFSLELNLPPRWTILEETERQRLQLEAIRAVFAEHETADATRLMHMLNKGESRRRVTEEVLEIVNSVYEVFLEAPPEAWEKLAVPPPRSPEEISAAISALRAMELGKRMAGARDTDCGRAEQGDWAGFVSKGLAAKVLAGDFLYYRVEIPGEAVRAYELLLEHAKHELLLPLAQQTAATRELLERFHAAYEQLRRRAGGYTFTEITRLLAESGRGSVEQDAWRLDGPLEHLLLDEFQDTSMPQWRVLRPRAEAIAARPHGSVLVVGDGKQAIYGWRGGVAAILDAAERELNLHEESLNTSYRSSPVVIEFVNQVFQNLMNHGRLDDYEPAVRRFQARFPEHSAHRTELPGYVALETSRLDSQGGNGGEFEEAEEEGGENGAENAADDPHFAHVAQRVKTLRAEHPGRTLAVLVRSNKSVSNMVFHLRRAGVRASEEGKNQLIDSAPVEAILALFTLVDHPGDAVAAYHVARGPLGERLGFTQRRDFQTLARLTGELRRRLLEEGYGVVVRGLCDLVAADCDARQQVRLQQFIELAYGYDRRATLRPSDFVHFVTETRITDSEADEVRVMNIHQCKGLEFDLVVLPETDGRLNGQPPSIIADRPDPTGPIDLVSRYVNKDARPFLPESMQGVFQRQTDGVLGEALCVLYVALTRAKHALHVMVKPSRPNEKSLPKSAAGLLRAALQGAASADLLKPLPEEKVLYEAGDPAWSSRLPAPVEEESEGVEQIVVRLAAPAGPRRRGLERISPSGLKQGPAPRASTLLHFEAETQRRRGTLFHAAFEAIEWLEEFDRSPEAIHARLRPLLDVDDPTLRAWIAEFLEQLAGSALTALLTRGERVEQARRRYGQTLTPRVHCEYDFAVRRGNGLLAGTIDRLVVWCAGDHPVGAEVIDFKTDAVDPTQDAERYRERVEQYRPQLAAYREAAAEFLGLAPEAITCHLAFTTPGVVAEV